MTTMSDLTHTVPSPRPAHTPLVVTEFHGSDDEVLNAVPNSACPTCHRRGQMLVTRTACIWPCRKHQTRLPLHGNHRLSPARARPKRTAP